jgi:putative flippase GtrA
MACYGRNTILLVLHDVVPASPTMKRSYVRYAMVGLMGTLAFYALLWILVELARMPVMYATNISFLLVIIQNYLLHYGWTFRSDSSHKQAFPLFLLMSILGFCLNWLVMYVFANSFGWNYLLVQALAIILVVIWNFVFTTYLIFRSSNETASPNKF